ncbi:MAG TPA: DNA recombination protein RmuC [Patescibacteria group bacterium]|jgi:DNA recombination protein RmuC
MSVGIILLILVVIAGFTWLYFGLRQLLSQKQDDEDLEGLVNKVFGMSVPKIAAQSKEILSGEKEAIKVDLENKQKVIEKLVNNLQTDLAERQKEIRSLEQDRVKKFSEITTTLTEHRRLTEDLKTSTQQLSRVLSDNQKRGAWGERIIEDLLQSGGLVEGVHYSRQTKQAGSTLKPDITLLLPENRNIPVDVKFPYQAIQKISAAQTPKEKQEYAKEFKTEVKFKIDKVAEYINPASDTLDYAILFVPNEMIFSFINQSYPALIDYAIEKRVIIVSPFTFLIVASTVRESYRNFMIGGKLKKVVKYIDEFVGEWGKFRDEFDKFGRSIDTLRTGYEKITTTRTKQLERKIEKIDNYRQGSGNLLEGKTVK